MTKGDINKLKSDFVESAIRSVKAGFQLIGIALYPYSLQTEQLLTLFFCFVLVFVNFTIRITLCTRLFNAFFPFSIIEL